MQIEQVEITELHGFERNPKQHPPEQIDMLVKSMGTFGFTSPILALDDGMVVAGHGRLLAAKKAGLTEVPVIRLDMPYEKAVAYVIADNRLAEIANTDEKLLAELVAEVADMPDFDIEAIGYTLDDMPMLLGAEEDDFDADAALDEIDKPITKMGDIITMGRHRLMCADARTVEDVEILMGGKKADMMVTDPPYNVDYVGKTDDALTIDNDSMTDEEFDAFLLGFYGAAYNVTKDGGAWYVWHADAKGAQFRNAMSATGVQIRQCIIWVKNAMVMGRQDYQWKHRDYTGRIVL